MTNQFSNRLKIIYVLFLIFINSSLIADNFKYSELQIKDYNEMLNQVKEYIQNSKKHSIENQKKGDDETGDRMAIEELRNGLKFILSRPDDDNMISKLLPFLRSELKNYSAFEDTLFSLAQESVRTLMNDKMELVYRSTSLFIIENIMSQIRPEIKKSEDLKKIIVFIKDSKIEVPKKVQNERQLRSMYRTKNPSDIATAILKN